MWVFHLQQLPACFKPVKWRTRRLESKGKQHACDCGCSHRGEAHGITTTHKHLEHLLNSRTKVQKGEMEQLHSTFIYKTRSDSEHHCSTPTKPRRKTSLDPKQQQEIVNNISISVLGWFKLNCVSVYMFVTNKDSTQTAEVSKSKYGGFVWDEHTSLWALWCFHWFERLLK